MQRNPEGSTGSGDANQQQLPDGSSWSLSRLACDYLPPLAAAVSGTVAFGNTVGRVGLAKGLALAGAAGSVVRTSTKAALEHCLLKPEERTLSLCDIPEGALNGISGVAGSWAEKEFSLLYTFRKGVALGYSGSAASLAGEQIISQIAWEKIKHNFWRGVVGGAIVGATDTTPRSIYHNSDILAKDLPTGLANVRDDISQNALLGVAFGGGLSATGTALWNSPSLLKQGQHLLAGAKNNTRVRLVHVNDWHSELNGPRSLSRAVTINNELRALSEKQGISHITVSCGDEYSGNAAAAYTKGGLVENQVMAKHLKLDYRLDGNHQFDTNRGDYDLPRHFDNMAQLRAQHPQVRTLIANLDHSAYPDYQKLVDPYWIHTVKGPNGPQKLGIIGLSTPEGAQGAICYLDPQQVALKCIKELQQQGVRNNVLLTHLGFSEDIKLARYLSEALPPNQRPVILGGHSHDYTATPHIEKGIPIAHAGSNGRYVGEIDLSIRPDGSIDVAHTTGRMHHLNNRVAADAPAQLEIDSHLKAFHDLGKHEYDVMVKAPYSIANIRSQETPLGNLTSDATMDGVKDFQPDLVINHSGGIRSGLNSHETVTRQELSNIFINSGIRESERGELVMCNMTGRQIREALEFGLQDLVLPGIAKPNLSTRILDALRKPSTHTHADKPGNFCQISGGTYSFDLSKPPRVPGVETTGRLLAVNVKSGDRLKPLQDDAVYKVVTRYHPLDKWHQYGVMGNMSKDDFYRQVQAATIPRSQVDLLGNYVAGKTIDPQTFAKVDGRISDLTPYAGTSQLYPGWSAVTTSLFPTICKSKDNPKQ